MKLTDEQIAELAPDWATHYSEKLTGIIYQSSKYWQGYTESGYGDKLHHTGVSQYAKPIQRKKFDISEYEFSDEAKDCGVEFRVPAWAYPDIEINVKDTNGGDNTGLLMKEHAVAIAKHFKLTAKDLR